MSAPITLEQTATDRFVAHGGPCDGTAFVVRRSNAKDREKGRDTFGHLAEVDDGLRSVAHGHANITDLEEGVILEVRTDAPPTLNHHKGADARKALEQYLATEAVARIVEGANRMPMLSTHDLNTLRTVRPDFPEPAPRVSVWPAGDQWSGDVEEFWRLEEQGSRDRISALDLANLKFAMSHASPTEARTLALTKNRRKQLGGHGGYRWYTAIPRVASIRPARKVRDLARKKGVHVTNRIRIEVRAEANKTPRRIDAPLWLASRHTLVIREGFEPTVDLIATMLKTSYSGSYSDKKIMESYATELLGMAGERDMHAALEKKYTERIRDEIGNQLDVTVTIRPRKDTGDHP